MQLYAGTKVVKAKPMDKGTFIVDISNGVDTINSVHSLETYGYLVGYPDAEGNFTGSLLGGCSYLSWSPAEIFESVYRLGDIVMASDGYHSFNELYEYRKVYNAMLVNEWAKQELYDVHKSFTHSDGELCFDGKYFVVVVELPTGQVTNHYEIKDWELFQVPIKSKANVWDGHTPIEALQRLMSFLNTNVL